MSSSMLTNAQLGVGAHGEGEGVLRGQAVAATVTDASALHVVEGDARTQARACLACRRARGLYHQALPQE